MFFAYLPLAKINFACNACTKMPMGMYIYKIEWGHWLMPRSFVLDYLSVNDSNCAVLESSVSWPLDTILI